ncbi:hypothetical protein SAMN02910456_00971 [Ruminococcaceae bacterium YRB3002]|nr:hypothetical protein SAMN02910456_00971 [Ruminococcaceae bacterium YRB3002]
MCYNLTHIINNKITELKLNVHRYIFNSRDVAAYIKYFSVPQYLEVSYMQYIFNLGPTVLAVPLTRDFEAFKKDVYRELYFLWANGFEDEKSDIACMIERGQLTLICDQDCINLESYMKLITLHLIFTRSLPYANLNFYGLPLQLGIRCDFADYERNVVMICEALQLTVKDRFGMIFDLNKGVPDELLRLSLNDDVKKMLNESADFKQALREAEKQHMAELRENSRKVFGSDDVKKRGRGQRANRSQPGSARAAKEKKVGRNLYDGTSDSKSNKQPKGAPKIAPKTNTSNGKKGDSK